MTQRSCITCGASLPSGIRGNFRYCSQDCQPRCQRTDCENAVRARGLCSTHWNKAYGKPQRARLANCAVCGDPVAKLRSRDRVVCSDFCRAYLQYGCRSSPIWSRTCAYCEGLFISREPEAQWCSPVCELEDRGAWPTCRIFARYCDMCDKPYTTRYTVLTCSPACARAKSRADRSEAKRRRRARIRDAYVAPVSARAVHERDRWRCHICGRIVRRDALVPHPMAPVIDHVVPLAAGGTHEPANVRTAHFRCNSIKSDGYIETGEQLMLIG